MATLHEIARRAGVSRATAASILSGKAAPTRTAAVQRAQRVRAIARQLDYRPNMAGRAIRSGRFQVAGVVTRSTMTVIHHNLLKGFTWSMAEHGYHVIQAELEADDLADPAAAPRLMREHCMDGMLVHYARDVPASLRELVESTGVPVVWANTAADHDTVLADDEQGAYLATRTLLEHGHRRIVYGGTESQTPQATHHASSERWNGYRRAMVDAGLTPVTAPLQLPDGNARHDERLRHFIAVVSAHAEVSAWVMPGSPGPVLLAAAALNAALPSCLSVVGFAAFGQGDEFGTRVSTMVVPMLDMGRAAADLLVSKMSGNLEPAPPVRVTYREPRLWTIHPVTNA